MAKVTVRNGPDGVGITFDPRRDTDHFERVIDDILNHGPTEHMRQQLEDARKGLEIHRAVSSGFENVVRDNALETHSRAVDFILDFEPDLPRSIVEESFGRVFQAYTANGAPVSNISSNFSQFLEDIYLLSVEIKNTSPGFIEPPKCFLAGTAIDMWDGSKKPIEEITPDDAVLSFDEHGNKVQGKVTRTFQNNSKHILDLHGLMITPGHAVFCAKVEGETNRFAGKYVPIMDILRTDGAIQHEDGILIRASTGYPVGSEEDTLLSAFIFEREGYGRLKEPEKCQIRLGTSWVFPDGKSITMREHMDSIGVEVIKEGKFKGLTRLKGNGPVTGFKWIFSNTLPKPEDYVLQRSAVTLDEVYQADEWEPAFMPQMPAPVQGEAGRSFKRDNTMYAGGANDHLPPNIPHSMRNSPNQPTMSRKQRRAYEAKQRKTTKTKRTTRVAVH